MVKAITVIVGGLVISMICSRTLAADEFPREWFWHMNDQQWQKHQELIAKKAPDLSVKDWVNGQVANKDTKGKVVVVDFWATWCGPCIASIPHNNEMLEKYKDKGLLIVGVCNARGSETMAQTVKDKGIKYPTAIDPEGATEKAWRVMWYPTYAVVDRKGNVRAIGLRPQHVEAVIKKLLEEKGDAAAEVDPTGRPWQAPERSA